MSLAVGSKFGSTRLSLTCPPFYSSHKLALPGSCTLLESVFRMATQDSSKGARRFRCCGGMCPRAFELAVSMDVKTLLPAWHQICLHIPGGLLSRTPQSLRP